MSAVLDRYTGPVVSPDGRKIAAVYQMPGTGYRLHVRFLGSGKVIDLPGTDEPRYPFWSPDSRQIAFGQNEMVRRVNIETGAVDPICDGQYVGGSWGKAGTILLGNARGRLRIVAATGGQAKEIQLGELPEHSGQSYPHFLPDGRQFVFVLLQRGAHPSDRHISRIHRRRLN